MTTAGSGGACHLDCAPQYLSVNEAFPAGTSGVHCGLFTSGDSFAGRVHQDDGGSAVNKRCTGMAIGWAAAAVLLASCTSTAALPTTLTAASTALTDVGRSTLDVSSAPVPLVPGSVSVKSPPAVTTPEDSGTAADATTAATSTAGSTPTASSAGTTIPRTTSSSTTTTPGGSTPTVDSRPLSKKEIADRAAIQAVWTDYWDIIERIVRVPVHKRKIVIGAVAVEPVLSNVLSQASVFDSKGWDNYGTVSHRPYWGPPVDGSRIAIMGDCLDNSRAGRLVIATDLRLTVGVARSNVRGSFERQADGSWRVTGVQFLPNQSC